MKSPAHRLVVRTAGVLFVAVMLAFAACGDDDSDDDDATAPDPTAGPADDTSDDTGGSDDDPVAAPLGDIEISVRSIATFEVPTAYRVHPDGMPYISEKAGRILDATSGEVALDVTDLVSDDGEQGFLGFAFGDGGTVLYVSYSDRSGDTMIAEYAFTAGVADPESARTILQLAQPFSNHNGGDIHVGPDGMLYIALGDGGSSGDPQENGQDPTTLLGSILRIDPTAATEEQPYGIPADNPFVDGGGAPEVYLYGVRNPWRIAFDPATDDLWVADVGQNMWEEVTVLPGADGSGLGANLGWDNVEGTHEFEGAAPDGAIPPVFEYSHDEGCSITGGFVYRGKAIPELEGAYLFADLCRSTLRALRAEDGELVEERTFDVDVGTPISFGVDPAGEIVVLSQTGDVFLIEAG